MAIPTLSSADSPGPLVAHCWDSVPWSYRPQILHNVVRFAQTQSPRQKQALFRTMQILDGFVESSLDCMAVQDLPLLPFTPLLTVSLTWWSFAFPDSLPLFPTQGFNPNEILACLTPSWCLLLGLSGLTHEVTLDILFHLGICFLACKIGLIIPVMWVL